MGYCTSRVAVKESRRMTWPFAVAVSVNNSERFVVTVTTSGDPGVSTSVRPRELDIHACVMSEVAFNPMPSLTFPKTRFDRGPSPTTTPVTNRMMSTYRIRSRATGTFATVTVQSTRARGAGPSTPAQDSSVECVTFESPQHGIGYHEFRLLKESHTSSVAGSGVIHGVHISVVYLRQTNQPCVALVATRVSVDAS